jgi:hypothetical protein
MDSNLVWAESFPAQPDEPQQRAVLPRLPEQRQAASLKEEELQPTSSLLREPAALPDVVALAK